MYHTFIIYDVEGETRRFQKKENTNHDYIEPKEWILQKEKGNING